VSWLDRLRARFRRKGLIRHYRRAELDPVDPDAVHDDAEATDHLGRLEAVRDRIEQIVALVPDERDRTVAWDLLLALVADVGRNR
jgi:DNA-directed RNA polymerase specialized sigma24 family protein